MVCSYLEAVLAQDLVEHGLQRRAAHLTLMPTATADEVVMWLYSLDLVVGLAIAGVRRNH